MEQNMQILTSCPTLVSSMRVATSRLHQSRRKFKELTTKAKEIYGGRVEGLNGDPFDHISSKVRIPYVDMVHQHIDMFTNVSP